jgi:hypothetical protein
MKNDDINKLGRKIYNFQSTKNDIEGFCSNFIVNLKTKELLSRNIEIKCNSIKDMIKNQRLIDQSLCCYLKLLEKEAKTDNSTYSDSFSVSYKFPYFISNIENIVLNTSISDKPYRISEVKTLGAYSNMEYNCWDDLDNNKIKSIFKGEYKENIYFSYKEKYAFSQIISLFGCESSRNPTTYITAPMVLELAEYFFYSEKGQETREDKRELQKIISLKLCHSFDKKYLPKLKEIKQSTSSDKEYNESIKKLKFHNELDDLEEEIDKSNYTIKMLNNKSLIIKDYFLNVFPMAINKAVSGSRVTSDKLNKLNDEQYFHQYDYGRVNINIEKELEEKNANLKQLWHDAFPDKNITDLVLDWYDIKLVGDE